MDIRKSPIDFTQNFVKIKKILFVMITIETKFVTKGRHNCSTNYSFGTLRSFHFLKWTPQKVLPLVHLMVLSYYSLLLEGHESPERHRPLEVAPTMPQQYEDDVLRQKMFRPKGNLELNLLIKKGCF